MIMILIKTIIEVLQQNAEWLCAVAITYFAWKQCEISKMQVKQDLRLKRLELANKLDEVCRCCPMDKNEKDKIMEFLISNTSNFIFLLNKQDIEKFNKFSTFVFNLSFPMNINASIKAVKQYNDYLYNVDLALGSADYGLNKLKDLTTPKKKGQKNKNEK